MNKNIGLRNWLATGLLVLLLINPISTAITIEQKKLDPNHYEKNPAGSHSGYFFIHGWYQSIEKVNGYLGIHSKAGMLSIIGLEVIGIEFLRIRLYSSDESIYIETVGNYVYYGFHHIIGFIGGFDSY